MSLRLVMHEFTASDVSREVHLESNWLERLARQEASFSRSPTVAVLLATPKI